MVAPRASARSHASSTRNAAPSPITKPSRPVSNGRDAAVGSSLRVLSAPMRANAAIDVGVIAASVPPHTTTSALPSRIIRSPSPIALAPDAQAVDTQRLAPVKPCFIDTRPAVALTIIIGTRNGLTRLGPRSRWTPICASSVVRPPTPVPAITATRAGSTPRLAGIGDGVVGRGHAEQAGAVDAADLLRADVGLEVDAARLAREAARGASTASNASIGAAVDRASTTRSNTSSTVRPAGQAMPMPVTAILHVPAPAVTLASTRSTASPIGAHVLQVVLGHLDLEAVLEGHHQLGEVEAVGAEVVAEGRRLGDLDGLDLEQLDGRLGDGGEDLGTVHLVLLGGFRW